MKNSEIIEILKGEPVKWSQLIRVFNKDLGRTCKIKVYSWDCCVAIKPFDEGARVFGIPVDELETNGYSFSIEKLSTCDECVYKIGNYCEWKQEGLVSEYYGHCAAKIFRDSDEGRQALVRINFPRKEEREKEEREGYKPQSFEQWKKMKKNANRDKSSRIDNFIDRVAEWLLG